MGYAIISHFSLPIKPAKDNNMENTNTTTINTSAKIEPSLLIQRSGTTFLIGIRFADKGDSLEDKVKRIIRNEVQSGAF